MHPQDIKIKRSTDTETTSITASLKLATDSATSIHTYRKMGTNRRNHLPTYLAYLGGRQDTTGILQGGHTERRSNHFRRGGGDPEIGRSRGVCCLFKG